MGNELKPFTSTRLTTDLLLHPELGCNVTKCVPRKSCSQHLQGKLTSTKSLVIHRVVRVRATWDQMKRFSWLFPESPGHNLALTALFVPYSLDSGGILAGWDSKSLTLSLSLPLSLSLSLPRSLSLEVDLERQKAVTTLLPEPHTPHPTPAWGSGFGIWNLGLHPKP